MTELTGRVPHGYRYECYISIYFKFLCMARMDFHIKLPKLLLNVKVPKRKNKPLYNLVPSPWNVSLMKSCVFPLTAQLKMSLFLEAPIVYSDHTPTTAFCTVFTSTLTFITVTYFLICLIPLLDRLWTIRGGTSLSLLSVFPRPVWHLIYWF